MAEITIRIARPEDAAALVAFNRAMAWETERKELPGRLKDARLSSLWKHDPLGMALKFLDDTADETHESF